MFNNVSRRTLRVQVIGSFTIALGLVVALLAALVSIRSGSIDRAAAGDESVASVAVLVPDDRLDPRVASLDLRGTAWVASVDRLDRALFAQADNDRKLAGAEARRDEVRSELTDVGQRYQDVLAEVKGLARGLDEVAAALQARALERYVNFGADPLVGLDDPGIATDVARSVELGRRIDEVQFSTRGELLERQAQTDAEEQHLLARGVELAAELASVDRVIADRRASVERLANEVNAATENVRVSRWTAIIPGTDLSVVALDAYLNAEELLAVDWAGCDIRWWMIAGVARIESRHGRFGGRSLRADGRVDRAIIGIALDGGPGVRAMTDTDDGVFDGDDVWDRAVGPLQFIPETWRRRGRDGSGDGAADPQNIYDAAYTAGRYLCALGGNLSSRASLRAAYFGYNNSNEYVDDVTRHADRYAAFVLPDTPDPSSAVVESVENVG